MNNNTLLINFTNTYKHLTKRMVFQNGERKRENKYFLYASDPFMALLILI